MPCRYEETPAEIAARQEANFEKQTKPLRDKLDKLTHENDQLREIVLKLATKDDMPASLWKKIQKDQVEHRKEDLRRLEAYFNEKVAELFEGRNFRAGEEGWKEERNALFDRIRLVATADPNEPLEPQLGFDPDEY